MSLLWASALDCFAGAIGFNRAAMYDSPPKLNCREEVWSSEVNICFIFSHHPSIPGQYHDYECDLERCTTHVYTHIILGSDSTSGPNTLALSRLLFNVSFPSLYIFSDARHPQHITQNSGYIPYMEASTGWANSFFRLMALLQPITSSWTCYSEKWLNF